MNKIIIFFLFLTFNCIEAQNEHYGGLAFNSDDCAWEKRSSLNLTANGKIPLQEKFTISVEISFRNSKYPGPIFTVLSREFSCELNFLQYANKDTAYINLIINQKETLLKIPLLKKELTSTRWDKLTVDFNLSERTVKISFGRNEYSAKINTSVKEINAEITFGRLYRLGVDTPPMNIREIQIYQMEVLLHYWKLNETEGSLAHDSEDNLNAIVENPVWLLPKSHNWQLCAEIGPFPNQKRADMPEVTTLLDEKTSELCLIGKDLLYRYNIISKEIGKDIFTKPRPHRYSSDVYNSITNKFLSQHSGQGKISEYDTNSKSWSSVDTTKEYDQHYYGHNLFVNPLNGDLMMINGYGWYQKKNTLQKYDFKDNEWKKAVLKGDYITPRSGAALINLNNTGKFLIFSGEGNESGKQEDGYRFLSDLFLIDLNNFTATKIWELKNFSKNLTPTDGAFYDETANCFYVIMMDNSSAITAKALYKFNIEKPEYEIVSNRLNGNMGWQSGLIFSKQANKFYMATRNVLKQKGDYYKLYELNFPPITEAKFKQIAFKAERNFLSTKLILFICFGFILSGLGFVWLYKRRKINILGPNVFEELTHLSAPQVVKNSIFLFGDFQVIDKVGKEITKEFSPKLKQLFLLLFTRSYNGSTHGINTEALSTYLWPDLNLEQTKNNRNVSMTKLRAILARLDGIEIKNEKNFLELSLGEIIYSDYNEIREILKSDEMIIEKIERVHTILSRGEFLSGCSFEWCDNQKVNFTEEAISKLKNLASKTNIDGKTKLALADSILHLDSVNEDGLILKIKAYAALGDHQLAKTTYELFKKEYNRLYAEEYQKSFADLLN